MPATAVKINFRATNMRNFIYNRGIEHAGFTVHNEDQAEDVIGPPRRWRANNELVGPAEPDYFDAEPELPGL